MNLQAHVLLALSEKCSHAPIDTNFPSICFGPGQSQPLFLIWDGFDTMSSLISAAQFTYFVIAMSPVLLLWLKIFIELHPEIFWLVPFRQRPLEIGNEQESYELTCINESVWQARLLEPYTTHKNIIPDMISFLLYWPFSLSSIRNEWPNAPPPSCIACWGRMPFFCLHVPAHCVNKINFISFCC